MMIDNNFQVNPVLAFKALLEEYQSTLNDGLIFLENISCVNDELRGTDPTIQEMLGLHEEMIETTAFPLIKVHEWLNDYLQILNNGIFESTISHADSKGNGEPHER